MRKSLFGFVLLLAVMCLSSNIVNAQQPQPKIGDAAPNLNLSKILQTNETATVNLNSLKGNVVVLEFWATWCGPCIPAITHFNVLSEKFKGKPVRFIAIADEDELSVARFTKAKPIQGWIGLDNNRGTFDSYQPNGIPHTVVIDRSGRIAAITNPEYITEAVLNDLLADKPISLPLKDSIAADLEWDKSEKSDGIEPLSQVIIKPSNANTGGHYNRGGHFTADGALLFNLVVAAYQSSPNRVINNLPESTKTYKVSVIVPPGHENTLFPLFQQALVTTFGISVRREMREAEVFVLSVPQGATAKLQPSQSAKDIGGSIRNRIFSKRQPIKRLAELLETFLGRPVIDKTGLTGEYDWELPSSKADKNVLLNAVREKLGLELTEKKQPIEMLIVGKQVLDR